MSCCDYAEGEGENAVRTLVSWFVADVASYFGLTVMQNIPWPSRRS